MYGLWRAMENSLAFSKMKIYLNPENYIILYCETLGCFLNMVKYKVGAPLLHQDAQKVKTASLSLWKETTFDNTDLHIASTNNSMLVPKLNLIVSPGKESSIYETTLQHKEKKQQDQRKNTGKYQKYS